jgi:hypothetical protein
MDSNYIDIGPKDLDELVSPADNNTQRLLDAKYGLLDLTENINPFEYCADYVDRFLRVLSGEGSKEDLEKLSSDSCGGCKGKKMCEDFSGRTYVISPKFVSFELEERLKEYRRHQISQDRRKMKLVDTNVLRSVEEDEGDSDFYTIITMPNDMERDFYDPLNDLIDEGVLDPSELVDFLEGMRDEEGDRIHATETVKPI